MDCCFYHALLRVGTDTCKFSKAAFGVGKGSSFPGLLSSAIDQTTSYPHISRSLVLSGCLVVFEYHLSFASFFLIGMFLCHADLLLPDAWIPIYSNGSHWECLCLIFASSFQWPGIPGGSNTDVIYLLKLVFQFLYCFKRHWLCLPVSLIVACMIYVLKMCLNWMYMYRIGIGICIWL